MRAEGLDVLLCEKSAQVGGTTATSAGTIWVPGTRQAREAGFTDTSPTRARYLDAVIGPAPDDRREVYLETGPDVVDYLDRRSEVKFTVYARHPDYLVEPARRDAGRPAAWRRCRSTAGCSAPTSRCVRPPIGEFMALGGMMIGRDDIEPLTRPFGSLASFRRRCRCCGGTRPIACAIGAARGC